MRVPTDESKAGDDFEGATGVLISVLDGVRSADVGVVNVTLATFLGVCGSGRGSERELFKTADSSRSFAWSSQRKKLQRLGWGFWHV